MSDQLTDNDVKRITRSLRDFGYTGLSEDEVRDAGRAILAGEEPADVIAMFVRSMLEEAGRLP